ncbi:hypothetical protein [Patulibacter sp.]|uniref:hypothetical protein n=1 Tax=Patulibacter sp. TaxID=1912859 RepID=UPI0027163B49|nr:hypothetical protein [Patulibacter sp.]MDO9409339.1 hypothetical protein [Patulibacter sp.]
MPSPLAPSDPDRMAVAVGAGTVAIGAALLAAPEAVGGRAWIRSPAQARVLGLVDVVIAVGLLSGRRRAVWMGARAVASVGTAAFFADIARRGPATRGPALLAGALATVSIADVGAARELARRV